jgi:putative DNA primase/helicase
MMTSRSSHREADGATSVASSALIYAERGWPVFPLRGKVPYTANGLKDATTELARVDQWWHQTWPGANVGIRTGAGLLVLDVDPPDGDDSLHELEREHGELPRTVQVVTGSGGAHYWFKCGEPIRNSAGRLGSGLDIRCEAGYVVAPPSRHESGRRYEWENGPDETPLAAAPGWMLERLREDKRRNGGAAKNGAPDNGSTIPPGQRNAALTRMGGAMRRQGATEDEVLSALQVTNVKRCEQPLEDAEVERIAWSVCRYEPTADQPPFTDTGNAERFAAAHAGRVRYLRERRQWLVWQHGRWRRDTTGEVERAAKDVSRSLLTEAARLEGDESKAAARWALTSQAEPRIRAQLALAGSEREVVVEADDLDADPWLLACGNGVLDLRTSELRKPDPDDLITRGTDVAYEPSSQCLRWDRFLSEVFAGDDELIRFVQRFIGYCLTADVREHVLVVFHGGGANGKSTLVGILRRLLGDFAVAAPFDSFVRQRDRGPRNDLARLHRARLVTAAESGEGRRLDEATVKEITGGDVIAARYLYGEFFEFQPQFKLVLTTNHRPRVDGDDDAIWRRLRLVPFEQSFEGREDRELAAKLEAELPGIFAWAVRGCLEWQEAGLGQAGAVTRATAEYREDEDVLGAFLAERCAMTGETPTRELREAYEIYCSDLGEKPLAANVLGRRLSKRGVRRRSHDGNREKVYQGVSLR